MRSNRTPSLVVAGLGLLVLVVFGFIVPSVRAGGFEVNGTVVLLSLVVPAILLVFLGIWGKR
ncbi:hypothetical protein IOD16_36395 [Saccharothrix sp. 6-C]|uniref:Uncharacterized protein n=1 Tax=Saccharothrix texasensis TaxID=103734 RepID=A0A3N1HA13_9PSEU|nr:MULTISPECIES: hypothetical protein [Saccharothrix]QQQ76430.1 hypothetical protein IOD16_36395 [Saccharothrix sp. 6-C]ROP39359.1 hypothetical protein EDD40_4745 [Saccharothrix texasensis]